QGPRRHHRGRRESGLPDRPWAVGPRGRQARRHGQAGAGGWGCDPQPGPGPPTGGAAPRHQVARAMRSRVGAATQIVFEVTRQVAGLAQAQLADGRRVLTNARRTLARGRTRPTGRLRALVDELQTTIQRSQRLLDQAHTRLAGGMPDGASGLVSLHDPDARPIRKGRIGRPVEFGYKAQVVDNPTESCSTTKSWSAT